MKMNNSMPWFSKPQNTQQATKTFDENQIEQAIRIGVERYFVTQKAAIPQFVRTHFNYPGCWQTNRRAFGLDLVRAPLNLIWAPFYVMLVILLLMLSILGLKKASAWAKALPGGLTTQIQRYVNKHIQQQILDIDTLKQSITESLSELLEANPNNDIDDNAHNKVIDELSIIVDQALNQLMLTRTASADITNTLFSTAAGAMLFKKFTPGGFGIGLLLAAYWAKTSATHSFFLGPTAGAWYYSVFTPEAGLTDQVIAIGFTMIVLAVFASFSGLVTDPIQSRLGLHQRRLRRMLNQLQQDLIHKSSSRYKPLDPYIARILELLDTVKAQVSL